MFKDKKFIPDNYASDKSGDPADSPDRKIENFNLSELVPKDSDKNRDFAYDLPDAANFDIHRVKRAKLGVIEIMRDTLTKAKAQAVEIRETAEKEAHDKGHAEGFKQGELDAREEFQSCLESAEDIIRELSEFRKKMYSKVEREMIEMVISLVKKVIHFELSTREDSIQEMIRLAVQSVLDKETMTIKINPVDKEHAENFRPELQHLFGEIKNIFFETSTSIDRGGCIIETNFGTVDAQMDQLGEQIDKILHLAPPPVEKETNKETPEKNQTLQDAPSGESLAEADDEPRGNFQEESPNDDPPQEDPTP
ncbi:Flagellar assembly protein FliH [hydrothermal vent metagenome]|uniref:Flagellar assembly protein FliH n=1 Tax=hydrothermal vent metagenome TaxID=652676 RepID=A0A3B1D5I1_9ZZZZ